MTYFMFALHMFFMTLSIRTGDMFGIILTLLGFLIMMYFSEEYDNALL